MQFTRYAKAALLVLILTSPCFADDNDKPITGGAASIGEQYRSGVGAQTNASLGLQTDYVSEHPALLLGNDGIDYTSNLGVVPGSGLSHLDLRVSGYSEGPATIVEGKRRYVAPLHLADDTLVIGVDSLVDQYDLHYDKGFNDLSLSRKFGIHGSAHIGNNIPDHDHTISKNLPLHPGYQSVDDYKNTIQIPFEVAARGLVGESNGHALAEVTAELGIHSPRAYPLCPVQAKKGDFDEFERGLSVCYTGAASLGAGGAFSSNGAGVAVYGRQSLGLSLQHSSIVEENGDKNLLIYEVSPEIYVQENYDPTIGRTEVGAMVNGGVRWGKVTKRRDPAQLPGVIYETNTAMPVDEIHDGDTMENHLYPQPQEPENKN